MERFGDSAIQRIAHRVDRNDSGTGNDQSQKSQQEASAQEVDLGAALGSDADVSTQCFTVYVPNKDRDGQEIGNQRKWVLEAIRLLSPAYRTVFNLFIIEGLTHEEIAGQLGISVGSSKSNLSKARENLRKILTKKTDHKAYVEPIR